MRRVVITGLGVVSPIGNSCSEVLHSLKNGISGIGFSEEMSERGFRSQVSGNLKIDVSEKIDKRILRIKFSSKVIYRKIITILVRYL